jgi:cytochrome c biogenesis protein CcmG/thiol:disulfide interchange protein DsbE
MKALRFLVPLLLFAGLAGLLAVGLQRDPRAVPSPLIDRPAPAFALARLDDATRTLRREDLLGQPYLLNVWASWCAPCREEHPHLVDFARRQSVPVYGLNYKDRRDAALAWLAQHGNPYRASLFDGDGRTGIDFGVYGVPETFVVDAQGVIRFKHVGALTPQVIRDRIEPLLRAIDG